MLNVVDCGGELLSGVEDVACVHCGQMEYPCECETERDEAMRKHFTVGRWYTIGYNGTMNSGECILKTNDFIMLRHPMRGVKSIYMLKDIDIILA